MRILNFTVGILTTSEVMSESGVAEIESLPNDVVRKKSTVQMIF